MQYIYIFEDGETRWSSEGPTPIDQGEVENGVLTVIRFEGSVPEEVGEGGCWENLLETKVTSGPEGRYHI